jgi:acyl-CoA reductase-like NAD-dependent aldehyde dehydrogenase
MSVNSPISATHFGVINPATGQLLDVCPNTTQAQFDTIIERANQAFIAWSKTSDAERAKALNVMADLIDEHATDIATLLTQEQGKPLKGLGSEFEVQIVRDWLRATAAMSLEDKVLEDSAERKAMLVRKPVGVVASITPWNWPLMIAIWHIAPAIRVGCSVVIKPANNTPLSTRLMVDILNKALPEGVLNVVTGDIGHSLSAHPDIHKVIFTGSTPVGRTIMRNASASLKPLTLELGGNDAAIVLPDIDIVQRAEALFWGAFINNGQTCLAIKRLYVHADIYDELCAALVQIATSMPMGNGLDEANIFGPIQNAAQYEKVYDLVVDAMNAGGRILCGGLPKGTGENEPVGYFFPLTIIADAAEGMRVVDEEQFGPVLPIIKYTDIGAAIASANNCELGLGGSVWSDDIELAATLATQLECGSVWVNNHGQVLPHIPFGGVKQSGLGVEFGEEGLLAYTRSQAVVLPK